MMVRNLKIAAAVAAALATGSAFAGAGPSPAAAANPNVRLYVAGSSAAKNAVLGALESNLCGGTFSEFDSTGNTNFFAVSCQPAASTGVSGANGTNIFTIWYRDEGGSVVGALPLVSGAQINQLNIASAISAGTKGTGSLYTAAVGGSSATNGIDDSFSSNVFKAPVHLGITDVEPGALIGNNYPTAYLPSVYGRATPAQLSGLTATTIFDQAFGIYVNTNSASFVAADKSGQGTATASLSLSAATIGAILSGGLSDWSQVFDTSGNAVLTGSNTLPITIVNREQGSGSRTAVDIFFTGDECAKSATPIVESTNGTADYFSTGNVLSAANGIPGAITYASIDNAGSSSNLTEVAVNGVQPNSLNEATDAYPVWFEATAVTGAGFGSLPANTQSLANYMISAFQTEATAPGSAQIDAIPGASTNNASLPISGTSSTNGGKVIYINGYTRGGVSCNAPSPAI
ncbi:MAG TPA: hypothetical protein VKP66_11025 [Steroidobacteraceae bacterium]|nr:hypothetical protein [Steroidobacteraceae bacterium]